MHALAAAQSTVTNAKEKHFHDGFINNNISMHSSAAKARETSATSTFLVQQGRSESEALI